MIVLAIICVAAIIYFNFYYQHRQISGIEERIGDGTVLLETSFRKLFAEEEITPGDLNQRKMIIFWATWSERAGELARMLEENRVADRVVILSAVVRDSPESVQQSAVLNINPITHVHGTPLYNELRIPGIPSVFVFNEHNEMTYFRIGYRESRDYDDLMNVLN